MKKTNINVKTGDRQDEIIRIQKKRNNFVMLDKTFIEDSRLSWKSKGILMYLLSKPDQWKVIVRDIVNHSTDGERAVYSGLKELKKYGYYSKEPVRNEHGTIIRWESVVYECPNDEQTPPKEKKVEKNSEKTPISPLLGGFADVENAEIRFADVENRDRSNINISNQLMLSNNESINQSKPKSETPVNQSASAKTDTDSIDTEIIKTCSLEEVADNISLEELKNEYPTNRHEEINMLYSIICEVLTDNPKPTFRVSKQNIPLITIKPVFSKLRKEHVAYVLKSLSNNDNKYKINKNAHNYLRTSLFNAPRTITYYYDRNFKKPEPQKDSFTTLFEAKMKRQQEQLIREREESHESSFADFDFE
jgi:hypothetical protein